MMLNEFFPSEDRSINPEQALDDAICDLLAQRSDEGVESQIKGASNSRSIITIDESTPAGKIITETLVDLTLYLIKVALDSEHPDANDTSRIRTHQDAMCIAALAYCVDLDANQTFDRLLADYPVDASEFSTASVGDIALCAVFSFASAAAKRKAFEWLRRIDFDISPFDAHWWLLIACPIEYDWQGQHEKLPDFLDNDFNIWPFKALWTGCLPDLAAWSDVVRWSIFENQLPSDDHWDALGEYSTENLERYLWSKEGRLREEDLVSLKIGLQHITWQGPTQGCWTARKPLLELICCSHVRGNIWHPYLTSLEDDFSIGRLIDVPATDRPHAWAVRYQSAFACAKSSLDLGAVALADAWAGYGLIGAVVEAVVFDISEKVDWNEFLSSAKTLLSGFEKSRSAAATLELIRNYFEERNRKLAAQVIRGLLEKITAIEAEKSDFDEAANVVHLFQPEQALDVARDYARKKARKNLQGYTGIKEVLHLLNSETRDVLVEAEMLHIMSGAQTDLQIKDYSAFLIQLAKLVEGYIARLIPEVPSGKATIGFFIQMAKSRKGRKSEESIVENRVSERVRRRVRSSKGDSLIRALERFNSLRNCVAHAGIVDAESASEMRELIFEKGLLGLLCQVFPELVRVE